MSCLFAVTTDLPAVQRSPDEIARRLEAAHQLDDDVGVGRDDVVDAVGPVDASRHPVDLLALDAAIADGRQLQRRMNPARQHLRDRSADRAEADDGDFERQLCLARLSPALCERVSTLLRLHALFVLRSSLFVPAIPTARLDRDRVEKRHHASQLRADLFDLMILLGRARLVELRAARSGFP